MQMTVKGYKDLGTHKWALSTHDCGGASVQVTTAHFINQTFERL